MNNLGCGFGLLVVLASAACADPGRDSDGVFECPAQAPSFPDRCGGDLHCTWEECCCGHCSTAVSCDCVGGTWSCVFGDYCIFNPCSVGCSDREAMTPNGCVGCEAIGDAVARGLADARTSCDTDADCADLKSIKDSWCREPEKICGELAACSLNPRCIEGACSWEPCNDEVTALACCCGDCFPSETCECNDDGERVCWEVHPCDHTYCSEGCGRDGVKTPEGCMSCGAAVDAYREASVAAIAGFTCTGNEDCAEADTILGDLHAAWCPELQTICAPAHQCDVARRAGCFDGHCTLNP